MWHSHYLRAGPWKHASHYAIVKLPTGYLGGESNLTVRFTFCPRPNVVECPTQYYLREESRVPASATNWRIGRAEPPSRTSQHVDEYIEFVGLLQNPLVSVRDIGARHWSVELNMRLLSAHFRVQP